MKTKIVTLDDLARAAKQVRPWLPMLRALTKELEKYPNAEFVDVKNDREHQHVRVRTHDGKLLIDVDAPDEQVHVACPLAMVRDVTYELESNAPGV